jgi:hypothetical protein
VLTVAVLACAAAHAAPATATPPPTGLTMPAPGRSVTLAEALAYARAHQPSLQAARARVAAAAADTRISRAQWLPGFGLTLQAFEGRMGAVLARELPKDTVVLVLTNVGSPANARSATTSPNNGPTWLHPRGAGRSQPAQADSARDRRSDAHDPQ